MEENQQVVVLDTGVSGTGVLVEGGQVTAIGELSAESAGRLDCSGCVVTLGDVNAHTHLYSGLVPFGMPGADPPPENFLQILERVWWRLDRALDEATLRAAARLYVAEALLAGTTTLVDHHESPEFVDGSLDVLAEACNELGIRALLTYGVTERNRGREEGKQGLAECRRFFERNNFSKIRALVGVHASFTVSDETLREAGDLCRELDTALHIHVGEDGADIEDAIARGYAGPLERIQKNEALVPGSILAHGVCLSEDQVMSATKEHAWFVQNPRSNEGNKVGYPKSLFVSDRVALGTDGYPADMGTEARTLLRVCNKQSEQEVKAAGLRCGQGRGLISEHFGATFGLSGPEGIYQTPLPGLTADLVIRRKDEEGGEVRHVMVGGDVVVRDGTLVNGEMEQIRADAQVQAKRLWQRMEKY